MGGPGLGLPIAERIIEAHGGFIEVENLAAERRVAFTSVRLLARLGGKPT